MTSFTTLVCVFFINIILAGSSDFLCISFCTKLSSLQGYVSAAGEDFYIEVSPGTYAITASVPEAQQQTQLVSVKAGESINLTFNI